MLGGLVLEYALSFESPIQQEAQHDLQIARMKLIYSWGFSQKNPIKDGKIIDIEKKRS